MTKKTLTKYIFSTIVGAHLSCPFRRQDAGQFLRKLPLHFSKGEYPLTLRQPVKPARLAALANMVGKPGAENEIQTGRVGRELHVKVLETVAHLAPRLSRASTNHCTQAGGVRRPLSQSCTVRTLRVGAILAAASLCDSWPRAVENSFDQSISYLGCSHCVKSSLTLPLTSARLSSLDAPNSKLLS